MSYKNFHVYNKDDYNGLIKIFYRIYVLLMRCVLRADYSTLEKSLEYDFRE